MKILPRLLSGLLVLLLLSSLTACSTRSKNTAHQQGATDDIVATGVALNSEEEESSLAEPEATAEEEIAALSQPGAWEYGAGGRNGSLANAIDLSAYDFPITVNRQVQYYLDLFQGKQRNYFTGWLARSARYRPFIEAELGTDVGKRALGERQRALQQVDQACVLEVDAGGQGGNGVSGHRRPRAAGGSSARRSA